MSVIRVELEVKRTDGKGLQKYVATKTIPYWHPKYQELVDKINQFLEEL